MLNPYDIEIAQRERRRFLRLGSEDTEPILLQNIRHWRATHPSEQCDLATLLSQVLCKLKSLHLTASNAGKSTLSYQDS